MIRTSTCPPDEPGWYRAAFYPDIVSPILRWWDGESWSLPCFSTDTDMLEKMGQLMLSVAESQAIYWEEVELWP